MKIQNIVDFFKQNSEMFKLNYSNAIKLANADALHDLRVSIKRINTLTKMLNYRKSANYRLKKSFYSLEFIFKIAAPVRDFQVLADLLIKYQIESNLGFEKLISNVNDIKIIAIKKFFFCAKKINYLKVLRFFKIIEHRLKLLSEKELQDQMAGFKSNHMILLSEYSNPESKTYNLHSARKVIKDLGYLMEMSEIVNDDLRNQFAIYKDAGRCLGDWHDRLVLQKFLNDWSNSHHSDIGNLDIIIKQVSDEKTALREQYFSILQAIEMNA